MLEWEQTDRLSHRSEVNNKIRQRSTISKQSKPNVLLRLDEKCFTSALSRLNMKIPAGKAVIVCSVFLSTHKHEICIVRFIHSGKRSPRSSVSILEWTQIAEDPFLNSALLKMVHAGPERPEGQSNVTPETQSRLRWTKHLE